MKAPEISKVGQSEPDRPPVITPGHTFASVTDKISSIVLARRTTRGWLLGFGVAFALAMLLMFAIGNLLVRGIGIWGVNIPVAWGFAIVNFVLVDRHRSCRNADLGDLTPPQPEVADVH